MKRNKTWTTSIVLDETQVQALSASKEGKSCFVKILSKTTEHFSYLWPPLLISAHGLVSCVQITERPLARLAARTSPRRQPRRLANANEMRLPAADFSRKLTRQINEGLKRVF